MWWFPVYILCRASSKRCQIHVAKGLRTAEEDVEPKKDGTKHSRWGRLQESSRIISEKLRRLNIRVSGLHVRVRYDGTV